MHELLRTVAEMRAQVWKLKGIIVLAPQSASDLRKALYDLEAAIHVMERAAADAYRAA